MTGLERRGLAGGEAAVGRQHRGDVRVTERLRQGIQHFEVTHPNLEAMMEQVVNTLSEMGI